MNKLISWISDKFIPISALFFLLFIPLYPKLPLFDIVNTWVYIRLEDVLVAATASALLIFYLKKKRLPDAPLTYPILLYWIVGIVSAVVSILFIGRHIMDFHPHLVFLHFARRIEYMLFFFLGFTAMTKTKSFLPKFIWVLAGTVTLIILYGLGQKFLGLPAFLTMNEEFAKGLPLRLPPTARIPSTFGGHYDLGAYLVFVIPIFGSLVFGMRRLWQKVLFFVLAVGSLILLLFTASRVSFGVYLVAISAMLIWQKRKRFILPVIILSVIIMNFVGVASERFYKTFRYENVIVDLSTGKPIGTLDTLQGSKATVEQIASPAEENLPKGSEFIGVQTNPSKQASGVKTVELYKSKDLATGSGEIATISGSFLIQKAFVYDISLTTRFQGQWPKAFEAFKRNMLLGSGFSTLSVAVDGDYMRLLGETGIIGSIAFLGIIMAAYALFSSRLAALETLPRAFVIGVFGGLTGLLLNAILIDVFEASKVAFSFWLTLGVAVGAMGVGRKSVMEYLRFIARVLTHRIAFMLYFFVFVVASYVFVLQWYFVADDFTWLKWATLTGTGDIAYLFTSAEGFFYRPVPKLWYFVLYSLFWLKAGPYHFMSLVLLAISTIFVYFLAKKEGVRSYIAVPLGALYAALSIHHENVYWISGQSSLLANVFLFGSILSFIEYWSRKSTWRYAFFALGFGALLSSMLSYDGMMIAPLIVWILGTFRYKQKSMLHHGLLALIPLYWVTRTLAGAVPPSGDYGYKLSTMLINVVANGTGYIVAIFGGPRVVECWEAGRGILREHKLIVSVIGGGISLAVAAGMIRLRRTMQALSHSMIWFVCFIVSLLAYLGLGGMAERYAFIASGLLIISLGVLFEYLWKKKRIALNLAMLAIIVLLFIWNYTESFRIKDDWAKASQVSELSLLRLRTEFFPLNNAKVFIFVDAPIRYGRAWMFPTGLDDALWHVFRLNPYAFITIPAKNADEAYSYPPLYNNYNREVFIFENYELKRLTQETQVIEQ